MKHIMIDLETMDNRPTAAIVAIGAVAFDPATSEVDTDCAFYINVDLQSSLDAGLTVSGSTVNWWLQQSEAAREEITAPGERLEMALFEFSQWLDRYNVAACGPHDDALAHHLNIWGNGSDFDNVILANAYHATEKLVPWGPYRNRCYRTLKKLAPVIQLERVGTHHNAVHDAISQAHHAVRLLQHLEAA